MLCYMKNVCHVCSIDIHDYSAQPNILPKLEIITWVFLHYVRKIKHGISLFLPAYCQLTASLQNLPDAREMPGISDQFFGIKDAFPRI